MAIRSIPVVKEHGFPVSYEVDTDNDHNALPLRVYFRQQVGQYFTVRYKDEYGAIIDSFINKGNSSTLYITSDYTVTSSDRKIECYGTLTITLIALEVLDHSENLTITNSSTTRDVTIETVAGDLIVDVETFTLYPGESLTITKGSSKYLAV